jgi:hypothetical protein
MVFTLEIEAENRQAALKKAYDTAVIPAGKPKFLAKPHAVEIDMIDYGDEEDHPSEWYIEDKSC